MYTLLQYCHVYDPRILDSNLWISVKLLLASWLAVPLWWHGKAVRLLQLQSPIWLVSSAIERVSTLCRSFRSLHNSAFYKWKQRQKWRHSLWWDIVAGRAECGLHPQLVGARWDTKDTDRWQWEEAQACSHVELAQPLHALFHKRATWCRPRLQHLYRIHQEIQKCRNRFDRGRGRWCRKQWNALDWEIDVPSREEPDWNLQRKHIHSSGKLCYSTESRFQW